MKLPRVSKAALLLAGAAFSIATVGGLALGHQLNKHTIGSKQGVRAPVRNPEETLLTAASPAINGCWQVAGSADHRELAAVWHSRCPGEPLTELDERPWLTESVYLPAQVPGDPSMAQARTHAVMESDLALTGTGALLYLPVADHSGYYVAGWEVATSKIEKDADGDRVRATTTRRGVVIGRYGAPPPSVPTPTGRVFLSKDFSPHLVQRGQTPESTDPLDTDTDQDDETQR